MAYDNQDIRVRREEKKHVGIFKRVKNWWNGLSTDQQWLCVTGIWTIDGLLWGSYLTAVYKDKKIAQAEQAGACKGYVLGQIDAYKEMASDPYRFTQKAFDQAKKDGKDVKTFNF